MLTQTIIKTKNLQAFRFTTGGRKGDTKVSLVVDLLRFRP